MNRRVFVASSASFAALAACSKPASDPASAPIVLTPVTAESLLARIAENAKSGKLTALHFWATWCGPCIEEFPLIEQEWRGWMSAEKGLDFLAVSVDDVPLSIVKKDGYDAAVVSRDTSVRKFIAERRTTFPNAVATTDDPDDFGDQLDPGWKGVLPSTLLFGLDGKLAYRNLGVLKVSKFGDTVRDLLSGKK